MFWKRTVNKSLEYSESLINTVREPLIALDQDLKVISANRSFYAVFRVKPEETLGQHIYNLGNKQWDIPLGSNPNSWPTGRMSSGPRSTPLSVSPRSFAMRSSDR
jgi:PAS domain-containing protein